MKTLLVPIDFTTPSFNAADYAADLSNHQDIQQIVLFSHFYVSLFEQIYPSADFIQPTEDNLLEQKQEILARLNELKTQLLKKLRPKPGIEIKVVLKELPLLRSVLNVIEEEHPDVLILGSNANHKGQESFIGNHMIEIAKVSPVPVLIIPPKARYQSVATALIACDFRTLNHVSLIKRIHKIKHWPHPKLALLNVDPEHKHLLPEHLTLEIDGIVKEVLNDYQYELYYSDDTDILHGVLNFADEHAIQMIIALPGVHSFLYKLTHQSITEGLSLDANKPVLILK